LYSDEATFTFAETDDHTAIATLRLPVLGCDPVEAEMEEGTHARADRG
jgi:hypothetical protein